MKSKITTYLIGALFVIGILFSITAPALAQKTVPTNSNTTTTRSVSGDPVKDGLNDIGSAYPEGAKRAVDIKSAVKTVIDWALYIAAIAAVLMIIYGGFLYLTARGNDAQAKDGRKTLVNALIGLVIIILSYMIVQIVYTFLTSTPTT